MQSELTENIFLWTIILIKDNKDIIHEEKYYDFDDSENTSETKTEEHEAVKEVNISLVLFSKVVIV